MEPEGSLTAVNTLQLVPVLSQINSVQTTHTH